MVHVKYPSMERQDLTQAQLGSFKFRPVDELQPVTKTSPLPHPLLAKQYMQSLKNAEIANQNSRRLNTSSSGEQSFYSHEIKPSLHHSCLKYDSIAMRQAIVSASASAHGRAIEPTMPRYIRPVDTQLLRSSDESEYDSIYATDYSGSSEAYDIHGMNQSLIRALTTEQDTHKLTKMSLETETARRVEAEMEHQKVVEHNKNLLNSIRLLQSTVKHMVQKQAEEKASSQKVGTPPKTMGHLSDEKSEIKMDAFDFQLLNVPDAEDGLDQAQPQPTLRKQMDLSRRESTTPALVRDEPLAMAQDAGCATRFSTNDTREQTGLFELPPNFRNQYRSCSQSDHDDDHQGFSGFTENGNHSNPAISSSATYAPTSPRIQLPDPQHIDWKMTSLELSKLQSDCTGNKIIQCKTPSSRFRQQPIRYMPRITERNIFRTCMVDFIPFTENIKYSEVLKHVRGGTLQSITMYGPIGAMTDFVTARVVFTHEADATAFYERGQSPGIKIFGQPVRVWQVMEPTYPPNKELEDQIYEQNYTRLLVVDSDSNKMEMTLKNKLANFISQALIIDISVTIDGATLIEFTSIDDAAKALQILMADPDFSGVQFDFEDDYCAGRYNDAVKVNLSPLTEPDVEVREPPLPSF